MLKIKVYRKTGNIGFYAGKIKENIGMIGVDLEGLGRTDVRYEPNICPFLYKSSDLRQIADKLDELNK